MLYEIWLGGALLLSFVLFIATMFQVFDLSETNPHTEERIVEARILLLALLAGPIAVMLWPLVVGAGLVFAIVQLVKAADIGGLSLKEEPQDNTVIKEDAFL